MVATETSSHVTKQLTDQKFEITTGISCPARLNRINRQNASTYLLCLFVCFSFLCLFPFISQKLRRWVVWNCTTNAIQIGQFVPKNKNYETAYSDCLRFSHGLIFPFMLQTFPFKVQMSVLIYLYFTLTRTGPIQQYEKLQDTELYLFLMSWGRLAEISSRPLHHLEQHDSFLSVKLYFSDNFKTFRNNTEHLTPRIKNQQKM